MGEYVTVGSADQVAAGAMESFKLDGHVVAVANVGGTLHAFNNVCTHRGCPLAKGRLEGTTVTCPCHGSQFDVTSGAVLHGPAEKPVDSFTVRMEGGQIQVQLS
jgi:3-phenylpropionate/trans-cinnamate dioxygenase ferredoxin subunit